MKKIELPDNNEGQELKKPNETKQVLSYFCKVYLENLRISYIPNYGKDMKLFKLMLTKLTLPEIAEVIDSFFKSDIDFIRNSDYSVGVFSSQVNRLRLEKVRTQTPQGRAL